jgi:hypothetical protein
MRQPRCGRTAPVVLLVLLLSVSGIAVFSGRAVLLGDTPDSWTAYQAMGADPWFHPTAFRAFKASSYWNTRLPTTAPIDPRSSAYIDDSMKARHTQDYLRLTGAPGTSQSYSTPIYWARATDPLYTVIPTRNGEPIQVHVPKQATPAAGGDAQMTIIDADLDQVVGLNGASYEPTTDRWRAGSTDRYVLSSNGLSGDVRGHDDGRNFGHRGVPASSRAVRVDEVRAGTIDHRLECYWWATAPTHHWPLSGHETGKGGVVPEGMVIRVKPSVDLTRKRLSAPALVIARALQDYGCLIGDNSGSGNRLKLERNEAAWQELGLTYDALAALPWTDWEFVAGGYAPEPP